MAQAKVRRFAKRASSTSCFFILLCTLIVHLVNFAVSRGTQASQKLFITCNEKDWSCGSSLYEVLASELHKANLDVVFKRRLPCTRSKCSKNSLFFVGADYELTDAFKTQGYRSSRLRVLLHLEPYELKLPMKDHGIDILITTTQRYPATSFPVVIYLPYFLISTWQARREKTHVLNRRTSFNDFHRSRRFMVYATTHCRAAHRTDFYDFVSRRYRTVEYSNKKCGELSKPSKPLLRADRRNEKTWMKSVVQHYSKYKFAAVFENCISPGYVTEKLLLARLAGSIPVYYGSEVAHEFVNSNAFIDCTPRSTESQQTAYARCLETIRRVDSIDELWMEMYSAPFLRKPQSHTTKFIRDFLVFYLNCKANAPALFPACGKCTAPGEFQWGSPKFFSVAGCEQENSGSAKGGDAIQ